MLTCACVFVVATPCTGASLRGYLPVSCPSVAAVTAVDETGAAAAGYSNFLAANTATAEDQARVIAAPGTKIRSTISYAKVRLFREHHCVYGFLQSWHSSILVRGCIPPADSVGVSTCLCHK
jgi:hypothetical protein